MVELRTRTRSVEAVGTHTRTHFEAGSLQAAGTHTQLEGAAGIRTLVENGADSGTSWEVAGRL